MSSSSIQDAERPTTCVWCESPQLAVFELPVARYGARTYRFARCMECRVRFAVPFDISGIDYDEIQRRHTGYVVTTASNEYVRVLLSAGPERVWIDRAVDFLCRRTEADSRFDHVLRFCADAQREGLRLRILEVGCNLGFLGAVIMRYGHEYVGLDIQQEAVARAKQYYGDHFVCMPVEQFVATAPVPFDLVCSFEVIEHVPEPRAFLESCLTLVAPQGRLVLSTPNGDLARDDKWFPIDLPPIHLTVFAPRTFEIAAKPAYHIRFPFSVQPRSDLSGVGWWLRRLLPGRRPDAHAPISDPSDARFYAGAAANTVRPLAPFSLGRYAKEWFTMLVKQLAFMASATFGAPIGNPLVVEFRRAQGSATSLSDLNTQAGA